MTRRVRDSLASTLGDPGLTVGYPIGEGRHVYARGNPVQPATAAAGQATTAVLRDGEPIAVLRHRADLLGDPRLVEEVVSAAGLAFQNERLQAITRAQLDEVRTSRTRLVAASDRERSRLERDSALFTVFQVPKQTPNTTGVTHFTLQWCHWIVWLLLAVSFVLRAVGSDLSGLADPVGWTGLAALSHSS